MLRQLGMSAWCFIPIWVARDPRELLHFPIAVAPIRHVCMKVHTHTGCQGRNEPLEALHFPSAVRSGTRFFPSLAL